MAWRALMRQDKMEPVEEEDEECSLHSNESLSLYSSSYHSQSSKHIVNEQEQEDKKALHEIGQKEEQAVSRVRVIVLFVLVSVAVAVSTGVYLYGYSSEMNEFETQFEIHAEKILTTLREKTELSVTAIEGFSSQIMMHASDQHMSWPNVTLSDFESRAQTTRDLALAISLLFYPIVQEQDREGYEAYTVRNQNWLLQGLARQRNIELVDQQIQNLNELYEIYGGDASKGDLRIPSEIFRRQGTVILADEKFSGPYTPLWQMAPAVPFAKIINSNGLAHPQRGGQIRALMNLGRTIIGEAVDYSLADNLEVRVRGALLNLFLDRRGKSVVDYDGGPVSDLYTPIFDSFDDNHKLVGFLSTDIYWKLYLESVIPENVYGIDVVMSNDCGQSFTYQLNGNRADYLGEGDLHDSNYDEYVRESGTGSVFGQRMDDKMIGDCLYSFRIYPSKPFQILYTDKSYQLFTIMIAATFIFTSIFLIWYQRLLQLRQRAVLETAVRSTQVVQELFPANVRDRLFEENQRENETKNSNGMFLTISGKDKPVNSSENIFGSKPIADFFPNTTIMFADLVGFTAWSSVREPTQVFTLLETIYHSFDVLAKNMRIFKVETIGDCYVAVAGLPTPRDDHPVAMATFAYCCLCKMRQLTLELEIELGPDTADLSMRVGLHSGPVTAGVLRGDKGRFQLFGDTINTTSRIESTGERDKVHLSRETAALLMDAGKGGWVTPREDKVVAKGKGELQTYWLIIQKGSVASSSTTSNDDIQPTLSATKPFLKGVRNFENETHVQKVLCEKTERSVNWNVEIIVRLLKQILATRATREVKATSIDPLSIVSPAEGNCVLDEVQEIIKLPEFDANLYEKGQNRINPDSIVLATEVVDELKEFVAEIASMYNDNPFHNFAHASQVTMSVTKLLTRIVRPIDFLQEAGCTSNDQFKSELHKRTFGITSDPLTHLACVISALIHDLDHPGVPNFVLVQEEVPVATKYRNKSVAEQNSVDLAWDVLMKDDYKNLRKCIYADHEEAKRFRQLVVNSVMATDIMDKDLGAKRKARWETAFREEDSEQLPVDNVNRKATIVIEHIIQASDIAHTMQHWHIYTRWNENLFHEMYRAYKAGRLDTDPSISWYKGEIGFFDFYIIPLTKKLETCGVFGVSSDEFLNYAMANRQEWIEKGEALVAQYLRSYEKFDVEEELIDN